MFETLLLLQINTILIMDKPPLMSSFGIKERRRMFPYLRLFAKATGDSFTRQISHALEQRRRTTHRYENRTFYIFLTSAEHYSFGNI
ncbi:hypothetical protein LguiB_012108 [Lonicera macranthoides]